MPDNLKNLYNSLVRDEYAMPSYDEFAADMQDATKRSRLYENISGEYNLPDYSQFEVDLGFAKKKESTPLEAVGDALGDASSALVGAFNSVGRMAVGLSSGSARATPKQDEIKTAKQKIEEDFRSGGMYDTGNAQQDILNFGRLSYAQVRKQSGASENDITSELNKQDNLQAEKITENREELKKYYAARSQQIKGEIEKINSKHYFNPAARFSTDTDEGQTRIAETQQKEQLLQKKQELDESVLSIAPVVSVKDLDPTKQEDIREAGWRIREFIEPVKVANERKYAEKGLYDPQPNVWRSGYDPMKRYVNEKMGLNAFGKAYDLQLEADPNNEEAERNKAYIDSKQRQILDENPEAKNELLASAIGNLISEEQGGSWWYTINKEKRDAAAKKLGIPQSVADKINVSAIPGVGTLDRLAGGFLQTMNATARPFDKLLQVAIGMDADAWDISDQAKEKLLFEQKFGEAEVQKFFQPNQITRAKDGQVYAEDNPNTLNLNVHSILRNAGHIIGQVLAYGLGGKALGTSKLAMGIGTFSTGALSTLQDNYMTAKDILPDEGSRWLYSALQSGKTGAIELLMPDAKFVDDIAGATARGLESFAAAIPKDGLKSLTKEGAKKWMLNSLKETVVNSMVKEPAEEILENVADYAINAAFDPKTVEGRNLGREIYETYVTTALGMVPIGIASSYGAIRGKNRLLQEALYEAGVQPQTLSARLNTEFVDGKITQDELNNKLKVVNTMADIVKDISGLKLSKRQKEKAAYNRLMEINLEGQLKGTGDPIIKEGLKEQVTELQQERKTIIANPEPDTNALGMPIGEKVTEAPDKAPVLTTDEFNSLQVGDTVSMETPSGKIITDTISEKGDGEVKLAKTGVWRNATSVDPANVGYRFLNPAGQKNAETITVSANPKTSVATEVAASEVTANIDNQSDIDNQATQLVNDNISKFTGIFKEMAIADPVKTVKLIADQAQGRHEDGTISPTGDAFTAAEETWGKAMVAKAIELFPITRNEGGQNAVQEQSPMENVLRGGDAGSQLPQVGQGNQELQTPTQEETPQTEVDRLLANQDNKFLPRNNVPPETMGKRVLSNSERTQLPPQKVGKIIAGEDVAITNDLIGKNVVNTYDGSVHKVIGKNNNSYQLENITTGDITQESVEKGRQRLIYQEVVIPNNFKSQKSSNEKTNKTGSSGNVAAPGTGTNGSGKANAQDVQNANPKTGTQAGSARNKEGDNKQKEPGQEQQPIVTPKERGIYQLAGEIEDTTDPYDHVLQHFATGGFIHPSAIQSIFGNKAGKSVEGEKRSRIGLLNNKAKNIDQLAHQMWENDKTKKFTTEDYRNAIESVLQNNVSRGSAARELLNKYSPEGQSFLDNIDDYENISKKEIEILSQYVDGLDGSVKEEILSLLKKYTNNYGIVDFEQIEKDAQGFSPDILNLSEFARASLQKIIDEQINNTPAEGPNNGIRPSLDQIAKEKIASAKAAHEKAVRELQAAEDTIAQNKMFHGRDDAKDILDPLQERVRVTKAYLATLKKDDPSPNNDPALFPPDDPSPNNKEAEIRAQLEEKIKNFRNAVRKSARGGTLTMGGIDPEVITRGIEVLALYAELGIHKFSQIVKELIRSMGKDVAQADIDALRGVYAYNRSQRTKEERINMESDDTIDTFYETELPILLKAVSPIPQTIKLGKEGHEYKLIGTNAEGIPIYENAQGVRSRASEKGSSIFVTEPVLISPGRAGLETWIESRPDEFKTTEELKLRPSDSDRLERDINPERKFMDFVINAINSNNKLTIIDLRKHAAELSINVKDTYLQELAETAVVEMARDINNKPLSDSQKFSEIVELYNRQPSFNMRSSERVEKQQYSTPAPISFVGGMYVGDADFILEPSAGNGLMTIYFPPAKVHVNEIDPVRISNLERQGYAVITTQDGKASFGEKKYDGVVTNPPFGASSERSYDGYKIKGLDEQMIINALDSMQDSGRAALIMGGHSSYDELGRLKSDRTFFNYLYSHYNVADVINIEGGLYQKQGTSFPIRLILINGRKETATGSAPLRSDSATTITSFDELFNRVNNIKNIENETILQSGMDARPGDGNPLYGADAITARNKGTSDSQSSGTASTANTALTNTTGAATTVSNNNRESSGTSATGQQRSGDGNSNTGQRPNANSNQQLSIRGNDQGAAENGGNRADETAGRNVDLQNNNAQQIPANIDGDRINAEKVPYIPRSRAKAVGSVIPTQMASEIEKVLNDLSEELGDIDSFVQTELGYTDIAGLYAALGAEQIDAVALGIKQIKNNQAMIIGDQTGVGKGRIAAAMIRWSVRNGHKPIFLTEKPNLFSDFYRDMTDIGSGHLVPFIVNDKSSSSDPTITDAQGNILFKPQPAGVKKDAYVKGNIGNADFLMATYSQFADNKETTKKIFLRKIAADNIIITDESHNMSGDSNTGRFFYDILSNAKGGMYLSATFAKRPDNIPIYAVKTAMSEANISQAGIIYAIQKGGVALQEVVSAELAEAGQMLRRERDFTGVTIDYDILDSKVAEYTGRMDNVTEIVRDIIYFQENHIDALISEIDKVAAAEGKKATGRKGTSQAGVDNVAFASKVFQVVHQLLFSLKALDIADAAIEEIKANRKPVIGFNSTMESFFNYMGLRPGDALDKADFSLTLLRGLEGTMRYTVKDDKGNSIPATFSLSDLSKEGQEMYSFLRDKIKNASTGIPISPIDAIIKRIGDAGYSVKEITGRKLLLKYDNTGGGKIELRSENNKNKIAREFNNGEIDVIMINASGATGISLHASQTFKDQRQRTFIGGQLELDVNTEVQKRGRTDRTGQVVRSRYRYVVSPIPAEKRLLMMLRSKLKSLDANTTSSQKQKTSDVAVVDFLNKHGDQAVLEYLANNQMMNLALRDPLKLLQLTEEERAEKKAAGGESRLVTGRVAILPSAQQEKFYNDVTDMYVRQINMLESMGQNDLEVKVMPLSAKTISSEVIIEGKGGTSPFGKNTVLEKVEANVLRKPLTQAELTSEIEKALNGSTAEVVASKLKSDALNYFGAFIEKGRNDIQVTYQEKRNTAWDSVGKRAAKLKNKPSEADLNKMYADRLEEIEIGEQAALDMFNRQEQNNLNLILSRINYFKIGKAYGVPTSLNADVSTAYLPGIFLGFEIGNSTENTYRPSNISMRFATPLGSIRMVQVPLSKTNYMNAIVANTNFTPATEWAGLAENWESTAKARDRQTRFVISGNILQGFNYAQGQLVSYTTEAGDMRKGILLPESWKPETDAVTRTPISKASEHLLKTGSLQSSNGEVLISKSGSGYTIAVPSSKVTGSKYYLSPKLRELVSGKDFKQMGSQFMAQVPESKLNDVLSVLQSDFYLVVNIPRLNLKTNQLPVALQSAHDTIAYGDGAKEQKLSQAAGEVAIQTASIGVNDLSADPNMELIQQRTFATDFAEQTVQSHVGYQINGYRDIADLFAMYRSPFIEKTHFVFLKDGVIVGNHSITSNSPVETPSYNPDQVATMAANYGADQVFIVHNHPSGNPSASEFDTLITNQFSQTLPQLGISFGGHVILNGTQYSFLDGRGTEMQSTYSTPQPELFSPRYQFSENAEEFQKQAVDAAHYILKDNAGQTGIVYVDANNKISGYDIVPKNATADEIIEMIKNGLVPNGAANYYIVSENANTDLLNATLPNGMLGEVSLNGGIRSVTEFKTEPNNTNPNELFLQSGKTGSAIPASPAPNTSNTPPPFNIELEKTSRINAFSKKTKKSLVELFTVGGGIDKSLRDMKEDEIGNLNELKAQARHLQSDFNHVIRQNYGKRKLTPAENEVLDKALKGDTKAIGSLVSHVQEAVKKLRDYIDSLTKKLIDAGVLLQADVIRQQIQDHMAQSAAAGVETNQRYMDILQTKLAFAEKIENNIGQYVNRAYLKYRVKNWRDKVSQEKIDGAVNYIYNEALLEGKQLTKEQIQEIIEDILQSGSLDYIMTSSKFAVNLDILKKLKDIPAPIRDLMGEVKEAEWNFMNTVAKMSSLLERHKFLTKFHDTAMDRFISMQRDSDKGFTTQIKQPAWGPLNLMWTTPELAHALKEWDGNAVDQSNIMKLMRDVNGLAKSVKTTLSWVSELRNLIGNVSLTMFNGNFNPLLFKKGLLAIGDVLNNIKGKDARLYVEKLNRLRIIGTSLPLHEIRGVVNELTAALPDLSSDDPLLTKKVWQAMVKFKNSTASIYGATDDIYKIMTWEMEKARLREAYGTTKTEEEIEIEAREITLRIMPTFSKVPQIVKTLSYNTPFIGTFISYPAEIMRTVYNSIGLSVEQMKSDNAEIRKIGAKRMVWQVGTAAMPYIVGQMAGFLIASLGYGVDDDEKEAVIDLLPEYYKNDNVIVWKKNGKYYIWMGSGWDGHSYIREIINAAVRGDGDIGEAIKVWSEPFAQPALPLQKVKQYIENKNQYGQKIILDADEADDKAIKTFKHFGELFTPQTAKDLLSPFLNLNKGNKEKAMLDVIKLASGQKVLEMNPTSYLNSKAYTLKDEAYDIKEKARKDIKAGKSKEDVDKWYAGRMEEVSNKYKKLDDIRKALKQ